MEGAALLRKEPRAHPSGSPWRSFARSRRHSQDLRAVALQGWAMGMLGLPWERAGADVSPACGCGVLVTAHLGCRVASAPDGAAGSDCPSLCLWASFPLNLSSRTGSVELISSELTLAPDDGYLSLHVDVMVWGLRGGSELHFGHCVVAASHVPAVGRCTLFSADLVSPSLLGAPQTCCVSLFSSGASLGVLGLTCASVFCSEACPCADRCDFRYPPPPHPALQSRACGLCAHLPPA